MEIDKEKYVNQYTEFSAKVAEQIFEVDLMFHYLGLIRKQSAYYTEKYGEQAMAQNLENSQNEYGDEFYIQITSLSISIVMLYSKLFDRSSKARSLKLEDVIFKHDKSLLNNHKALIEVRNQHVAHDEDYFKTKPKVIIGLTDDGDINAKLDGDLNQVLGFEHVESDSIFPLLDVVEKHLKSKKVELIQRLKNNEYELILENRLVFLERLIDKQPITQHDLDVWTKRKNENLRQPKRFNKSKR